MLPDTALIRSRLPSQAPIWQPAVDPDPSWRQYYQPGSRESRWRPEDTARERPVVANTRVELELKQLQAELKQMQVCVFYVRVFERKP